MVKPVVISVVGPGEEDPALPSPAGIEVRTADSPDLVAAFLPQATAVVLWEYRAEWVAQYWDSATPVTWIHVAGSGLDGVDVAGLSERGIVVTNAREVLGGPVAEYAVTLLLALFRRIPESVRLHDLGQWLPRRGRSLSGTKVAVLGVGTIGSQTGRLLRAFDADVMGVGQTARPGDGTFRAIVSAERLHDALDGAEAAIIALPATPATVGMFGLAEIETLAPGAVLLNVGRGGVIDEVALMTALDSGHLSGAALDVFSQEPLPSDHALWRRPDVLVSPHSAARVAGIGEALRADWIENVERWLADLPLRNVVDPRSDIQLASLDLDGR